jgi:FkbM family methyltransferase
MIATRMTSPPSIRRDHTEPAQRPGYRSRSLEYTGRERPNAFPMSPLKRQLTRARKLLRVLREPQYRRAVRHGVAASIEYEGIPFRGDYRTVIDVGANRGQFALFAARRFPAATLICFEPLPKARARLMRVVDGHSKLRVFDLALSDQDGTAEFHVSKADDSSSLLPIGRRQREAFPGTDEQTTIEVTVRRLDDVLEPADLTAPVLLKIDVQGAELGTLRGAEGLFDSIDAILVEASFVELYAGQALVGDVWSYLQMQGFSCHGIWSATYGRRGECLQGDFLFSRDGFDPLAA